MFTGNFLAGLQQFLTGQKPIAPQTIQPVAPPPGAVPKAAPLPVVGEEEAPTAPTAPTAPAAPIAAGVSTEEAQKALKTQIELAQKLAQVQRDTGLARLSDEGKLAVLQRELNGLKALELTQEGGTLQQAQTLLDIGEKEAEIEKLGTKMTEEKAAAQQKSAQLREQMADAAEKELRASHEAVLETQLELSGRKDLAERAKIEFDFNEKILDVQKDIKKAEDEGLTDVANTNRALVTQLSLEEQTALAAHDKATAEKMAAEAAEEKASVESEKENLGTLEEEAAVQALINSKMGEAARELKIQYDYNHRIKEALTEANSLWTKMAQAYRDGNKALGDQFAIHAQLKQAEADELEILKQQVLAAEQMRALEVAQQDTIKAGIALEVEKGSITSETAALEQRNVDLQIQSNNLAIQIDAAYATGNTLLARQLEIQQNITDQQAQQARNAAFANQLRTMGTTVGQPGTDALARMAAAGISMGATGATYAAALAASRGIQPGSPEYNQLVQRIRAEDMLRNLQGRNLGWFEQLNRDRLVQWYAGMQAQQASMQAAISQQQQIEFWGAIAQGMPPPAGNPYALLYGTSPFMPGNAPPTGAAATNDITTLLRNDGLTQTQILQVLQQIAANTAVVSV